MQRKWSKKEKEKEEEVVRKNNEVVASNSEIVTTKSTWDKKTRTLKHVGKKTRDNFEICRVLSWCHVNIKALRVKKAAS